MAPDASSDCKSCCGSRPRASADSARNGEIPDERVRETLSSAVSHHGAASRAANRSRPTLNRFVRKTSRLRSHAAPASPRHGKPSSRSIVRFCMPRPARFAVRRSLARELADSMWAELYGVDAKGAQRRSLLDYFHGRSSLATWLRAILAQRHIDGIRATRRFEPLENVGRRDARASQETEDPPEPGQARMMAIFAAVLSAAHRSTSGQGSFAPQLLLSR